MKVNTDSAGPLEMMTHSINVEPHEQLNFNVLESSFKMVPVLTGNKYNIINKNDQALPHTKKPHHINNNIDYTQDIDMD